MSVQGISPCSRETNFEGHLDPGYPGEKSARFLPAVNLSASIPRVLATDSAFAEYCLWLSLFKVLKVLKENGKAVHCAAHTPTFSALSGEPTL